MAEKKSKLETVMDIRIKVIKVGNTENIQMFRGTEYIGLMDITDYERSILEDLATEVIMARADLQSPPSKEGTH